MAVARDLARYAPSHLRDWATDEDWQMVDGSLCLVDISGFTALSEKLAALGRIGAEELTEVLGRVFGEMLEIAGGRGGTLLKFGGDALLLLFESEDHAVQAASAAVEMRTALRAAKDIPTSVGRLDLKMSQGIHSGETLLIHTVGSHRELIVAGPAASWVAHMESIADANEIVVSATTEVLLPPNSVSKPKGDGGLLRWRTAKIDPVDGTSHDSERRHPEASHVPIGLRDHLASGAPDSEHRQATVGFIKVAGTDDLIADVGIDAAIETVHDAVSSIMDAADEESVTFLGTDVDTNVFKVILVSGVPASVEDEEGRLLRVARRVADLDTPLSISIGVNKGHVFSGEIGVEDRATYTIMGDTVNLAARLMAAAPPGDVYASPSVVNQSLSLFGTSDVKPLHVKGKAQPVRALSVGAESGSRALTTDQDGVFVGREEELKTLRGALRDVHEGRGGAFVLAGPRGIGKTRLLTEALCDAVCTVVDVRAEPYGTANPYRPFRDPIRMLLGIDPTSDEDLSAQLTRRLSEIDDSLTAFAPLLGDIAHIDADPTPETEHISGQFRQDRAADVLIDVLRQVTVDSVLLTFEDVHWADAASSALLDRLVKAAVDLPWLIVQTRRDVPEDVADKESDLIELAPLSEEEVEQLIHAETESAPLRPDVVAALAERSGGSPLFTHELLNVIKDTGDADSLPTSLEGVVGTQIDGLEPLARRVLRYVSVLGRSFRSSVARDLIATQGLALDDAARTALTGFLDNDGADRLQFRHAIVRDVAYEGLSFKRRKELHRHAGQLVLDQYAGAEDSVADVLALHFYSAGDHEKAWRFCTMAGDRNMERYANVEAAVQFDRALEVAAHLSTVDDRDRRETYFKLGDARERSGKYEASMDAYRHARRHTEGVPLAHAEVLLKLARARERSGAYPSALSDTTRSRRLLQTDESVEARELRARALSYGALIRQAQQRPSQSLELALGAASEAAAIGDEATLARAWRILDWCYFMLGEREKANFSLKALAFYETIGDFEQVGIVSNNLGGYAYFSGDWNGALGHYERGREAALRAGNNLHAATSAANIGEILVNQGHLPHAREALLSSKRTNTASGFEEGIVFADMLIGRIDALEGDLEQAHALLSSAAEKAEQLGIAGWQYEASIYIADVLCRAGSPDKAIAFLDDARHGIPDAYAAHYAPLLARVQASILQSGGRAEEAVLVLRDGANAAEKAGDPFEFALLTLTLAALSADEVDTEAHARVNDILKNLGVSRPPLSIDSVN